jgi:two-component system OmpR family response regulator
MDTSILPAPLTLGLLAVDPEGYRAWFDGALLDLNRSQIELLAFLIEQRHRVVSRPELAEALGLARGRSVDVVLSRLRRSVGRDFVRNVRSRGWIVEPSALDG